MIKVTDLSMTYKVAKKKHGFLGSFKSLIQPDYEYVKALQGINLKVNNGEVIGFIGPNGAGKTTLLKILSGLIHPTSGEVTVDGYKPFKRSKDFKKNISLVLGQKSQLMWDIPAMETFHLNRAIYRVEMNNFNELIEELVTILDVSHRLDTPVRQLSLGERMKMELIASLIHKPNILFLDEPTIGLDIKSQIAIREFIKKYVKTNRTTTIITSHYMEDIKSLCERIVIINEGKILYDGPITDIYRQREEFKYISVKTNEGTIKRVSDKLFDVSNKNDMYKLTVHPDNLHDVIRELIQSGNIQDLTIEKQPIEELILTLLTETEK
ncbi:ATP-binding cassette domain-containing protein [Paenibacillus dendritiformis]|uniref:ABC transporter ATP-binding protein n=1 Tax=Paenibacillus dendritiformis TaxID=130049 RepID=UPI00143DDD42|nr:ATP-binding cassette domain-containing protein [Paenibacillus dendritiformis]NKI20682.1 ATP-binding cassette domain-containing protein [Paenibacillus dendritiformis]NRF96568.1 ATP-binding cassette domain-containing protein [Paenibacillus dendritiformis]